VVLVVGTTLAVAPFSLGALGVALWAMLPYVVHRLLARRSADPWPLAVGGAAILAGDLYIRAEVFLFPRGSTAAIALLFSPLWLTVVALPAGLALGWLGGRGWRRSGPLGRGLLVAVAAVGLLAGALTLYWPALLPGPLARRVSAKERIGTPRVVLGHGVLVRTRLSERPSWIQVGRFGEGGGEALAAVTSAGAVLLDPTTGAPGARLPFAEAAGRRWNWASRLVRDGPDLLIVQTGGGFQDVGVFDLAGNARWTFRPDRTLPPIALLPRDLDGDGRIEYYAASKGSVYRLDGAGRVVWERASDGLVNALDAAPAGGGKPGLVMAVDSMRRVRLWSPEGKPAGELSLRGDDYRFRLVDWPGSRSLAGGSASVRVLDLEGRPVLEHPLGDFRLADAIALSLDGGGPMLAVLAAAPREVGYWRLLIFSPDGALVYDEILPGGGTLLAAPDRGQALLLSGGGLWTYRKAP
jgi:hypothetical protein